MSVADALPSPPLRLQPTMLAWTRAGAVTRPTTVQIRVQRSYPGRIRAGAPVPTRSMSREELLENVTYFTEGLRTPRTQPCTALVLSGVGVASRADTADAIDLARAQGVTRITLHAGVEDLGTLDVGHYAGRVDGLVLPVQPGADLVASARAIAAAAVLGMPVYTNTALTANALPGLSAAARLLASARPTALTFTYPFPINGGDATDVPPPPRAVAALREALQILDAAHLPATLKGLPACYLGPDAHRVRRTANRWYVDADHQRDRALLFFPDVVSFTKDEVCRFCAADGGCDGFFATYLRRPGFPPLSPLDDRP